MYSFQKSVKKADHVRRYSITPTMSGWEVREEQDSEVIRQTCYTDWHRVERAKLVFDLRVSSLRQNGWQEVG
jgi:hypothetical protein